ncbi:MAG TPA: acyl-CoA dehydrogenase [Caulobacteraceae bacterium]|nr:acyl-CoA dehydrogenase [Caulobacteraceae bacterium]
MIDLDLTPADEEVLAVARRQADIYRAHAKRLDREIDYSKGDFAEQLKIPGEDEFVHVRNLAQERAAETSAFEIIDALIYMEEMSGFKPSYHKGHGDDSLDLSLARKLLKIIGTEEQIELYSKDHFAWGMSEPQTGADPAALRTKAVYDAATDEWVVNGEKVFTSTATQADGVMVLCRCHGPEGDEGIGIVLLRKGTPGYAVSPQMKKLGLRNWDTVGVSFSDCRVPNVARLRGNLKDALSIFNGTRAIIAGQALGYARTAMNVLRDELQRMGTAVDYGADLAQRTAIEDRLVRLEALYDATYLTMLHAKWHEGARGRDKFYPSLAKMKAGLAVRKIITEVMNILGPMSTTERLPVEQALRDSRILDIYEGPNEVQKLLLGRVLLGYGAKDLN